MIRKLGWVSIPATTVAAYIILGLAAIGREIENPFGHDYNDLPLEFYCSQLAAEIDIISAFSPAKLDDFVCHEKNLVLYPMSENGHSDWKDRTASEIRAALKSKARMTTLAAIDAAEHRAMAKSAAKIEIVPSAPASIV